MNPNNTQQIAPIVFDLFQNQGQVTFNAWDFAGTLPSTGNGTMLYVHGFLHPIHVKDDARAILSRIGETLGISFDKVLSMLREGGSHPGLQRAVG